MDSLDINTVNGQAAQSIHNYGDNFFGGALAASPTTAAVEHPPQERELTCRDLGTDELRAHLRVARSERWRAWMRYWFNWPSFLVVTYSLGLLAWVLHVISTVRSFQLIFENLTTGVHPVWFLLLHASVILPLAFWLGRIRRIEISVVSHAQAVIDAIELEMRLRKGK